MSEVVRRVVTAHDASGRSVVVADGAPPMVMDMGPGEPKVAVVWSDDGVPTVPFNGIDPTATLGLDAVFPSVGGARLMMVRHPPGAGTHLGESGGSDSGGVHFDDSGMHATDTVDYAIVVSGTIHMELEDGVEVVLSAGDVLIQNGTVHAWRNRSDADAVVAVVLLGASRSST